MGVMIINSGQGTQIDYFKVYRLFQGHLKVKLVASLYTKPFQKFTDTRSILYHNYQQQRVSKCDYIF